MTNNEKSTRDGIRSYRDRRAQIAAYYGAATHGEAKRWFANLATGVHHADPYTGEPLLQFTGSVTGAVISACTGASWELRLGPSVTLERTSPRTTHDAEPIIVERWDVAVPDGQELHLNRMNVRGDAFLEGTTWRDLIDRLCVETIYSMAGAE